MPLDAAGRAGDEQHWQHDQRSRDKREKKRAKETHAAVDAAKSREHAEDYIHDGFEHGARSRRSTAFALQWVALLPDWLAYTRACQELVAAAPVVAAADEPAADPAAWPEPFRDSHISLWAFTNSR
jgi:hypothetical protein